MLRCFQADLNKAERMNNLFSNGLELANLLVSSDLLRKSWDAILDLYRHTQSNHPISLLSVRYKAYHHPPNGAIIAFVSSPDCTVQHLQGEEGKELLGVSATPTETSHPLFGFLGTKVNPSFSIHKAAITLFASLHDELSPLKEQFRNSNPLIITGHSLGGSIASLFTLWLLDSISLQEATKPPLCITFGSPLLGDNGFRKAILERPTWNPRFLHVVSDQDPVPKFFIPPNTALAAESTSQTGIYKPFGTFLLCSQSGCACFEEPESILEVMAAMSLESDTLQFIDYGRILEYLKRKALCRGISELGECVINPLQTGIILQLAALGVVKTQLQVNNDMNSLITNTEKRIEKFLRGKMDVSDPNKKLNDRKINMAHLEWYKKVTKNQGGYYDAYKQRRGRDERRSREEIVKHQRMLTLYWKNKVEEVEKMPQEEGAAFRTRWLYAGTNYRRMVEPLDIAEYYMRGKKDYQTQGRSVHYVLLEQWVNDEKPTVQPRNANERTKACSLTEDSCFWAHVEEAIISCKLLKNGESSPVIKESSTENLIKFEHYVMDLIRNYAVSPEIFWKESSFMQWWREYEEIKGASYNSPLTEFMKNHYGMYA